ncbi:hypothetical protein [Corynebacterium sp. HMSC074A09]|uniref:hypothetical protein n=1 Tax=Corynebacterium sp. HMSC074A09 TaxID=1739311 RepID=UPI0008A3A2F4|nr:hypothetical protein [Corynebacterium sp. HMSC074A09]OFK70233.1 hypothetical protein HMPREF2807_00195 [Corynebacterium sp. HMSC074A09]
MSNFSRGLLAATLTSSLAFAGATAASAEEAATTNCGSPKTEFTATVDGKEHTFKKVSEFLWQATDDEKVELSRADIFDLAKDGEDVCDAESIDIDDWGTGNDGGGSDNDETDGDDESDGNTGGDDDADNDDESEGGDDDADNDDESEGGDGGDDADNGDDEDSENGDGDESEGDKDKNKDKSSFDGIKDALSSEDGKPTDLGIAAIVIGVLGALAAIVPNAARALGIKLPF